MHRLEERVKRGDIKPQIALRSRVFLVAEKLSRLAQQLLVADVREETDLGS